MCGISVILQRNGSANLPARLSAMHGAIEHRGPDGEGFLALARGTVSRSTTLDALRGLDAITLGVAFRRLKICDLSVAASQPMGHPSGKFWLAFNGEIYNFRELRTELQAKGHVFQTNGDTEVILAAYSEWGTACFSRLEGMWAIVLLDLVQDRLVLSRDRFGIKPLFWMLSQDGSLLLASEIKQFACTGETLRSNRPLVEMFLRGTRYPFVEETFFQSIRAVPPATWCAIDLAAPPRLDFTAFWDLSDFVSGKDAPDYNDAVERTEALLSAAVDSHRQADVKTGALLSGGLDSATLVGLAHRNGGLRLPTYSLGYRKAAPRFCEMSYVDAMTKRDGLENHEISFDAAWVTDNTDRILWTLEEPPLAMPAFAQYRVFELCRQQGSTVVLDGQGADEIAAGYPYYQRAFVKDRLVQGKILSATRELHGIAVHDHRSSAGIIMDYFVRPYLQSRPERAWIASGGHRTNPAEFNTARSDYGHDRSLVNRQTHFDVRWGNVKIVLGYGDRNAMAHSIESRVPYFDRAFVEYMFSLPDTFKINHGDRKRVLRDVARRYVPPQITERVDRMGFGTPDEEMLRGPLAEVVREAVSDPAFQSAGWVHGDAAIRFVLDFHRGAHQDYRAVWRLLVLSRWARRFSVGE